MRILSVRHTVFPNAVSSQEVAVESTLFIVRTPNQDAIISENPPYPVA